MLAVSALENRVFAPDYLICVECESPCYVFEWESDKVAEAVCEVCGNEDIDQFLSQGDWDDLTGE